jgi:hypothetical protein
MRLWTIHPKYLDARGLVALWREALLARRVLEGQTRGYRSHPQLDRFRGHRNPVSAIDVYLAAVLEEADRRGYAFDRTKVIAARASRIPETRGQLQYEWEHLRRKLRRRAPRAYRKTVAVMIPEAHPLFRIVSGGVRPWERRNPRSAHASRILRSAT